MIDKYENFLNSDITLSDIINIMRKVTENMCDFRYQIAITSYESCYNTRYLPIALLECIANYFLKTVLPSILKKEEAKQQDYAKNVPVNTNRRENAENYDETKKSSGGKLVTFHYILPTFTNLTYYPTHRKRSTENKGLRKGNSKEYYVMLNEVLHQHNKRSNKDGVMST